MSDSAFKALADPTRRAILKLLGKRSRSVNEVVEAFALSQPAISRHLAVLRAAGLVSATRDGQSVVYALDTTVMDDVARLLFDLATPSKRVAARDGAGASGARGSRAAGPHEPARTPKNEKPGKGRS